jgi:transketolase
MAKQENQQSSVSYRELANAIRFLAIDAVETAKSGHPGMPMGMADIATVLFQKYLKFSPDNPTWFDRDRFVLSNGHGSMLLYALSYLTGYKGMTLEQIKHFRQLGYHTAGHPEYDPTLGIETTTGPLGQGFANAVGMALAERMSAAQFGDDVVDHHTYVFVGDGCLAEGISQEALSLAGHLKLGKLIVFFDDNGITIDGSTSLSTSDDQCARFAASKWHVQSIDGHDPEAIANAIEQAQSVRDQPSFIACKTTIGYGSPNKGGTAGTHGAALGHEEVDATRKNLGWPHAPFEVPAQIINSWHQAGHRSDDEYTEWVKSFSNLDEETQREFKRRQERKLPNNFTEIFDRVRSEFLREQPQKATRQLSQEVLNKIAEFMPELVGGSADLTGSNNTQAKSMTPVTSADYSGNYIHYGIREHGMAAVMSGIVLHGGFRPYGGTFLTFSDYCRPAIRLAALMKQPVIYIMSHDSIGLGEDGPTHQPIEHLAALRAIPNLWVMRPADALEVAECWQIALERTDGPCLIALTRQNVPCLRHETSDNLSVKGAYILAPASDTPQVTLIGTGSEVQIAIEAQQSLRTKGIAAQVVSMPSTELFDQQPQNYKEEVLKGICFGVEAATGFGWDKYVDDFLGMDGFGASAPAPDLYKHFGITAVNLVEKVIKKVGK